MYYTRRAKKKKKKTKKKKKKKKKTVLIFALAKIYNIFFWNIFMDMQFGYIKDNQKLKQKTSSCYPFSI